MTPFDAEMLLPAHYEVKTGAKPRRPAPAEWRSRRIIPPGACRVGQAHTSQGLSSGSADAKKSHSRGGDDGADPRAGGAAVTSPITRCARLGGDLRVRWILA